MIVTRFADAGKDGDISLLPPLADMAQGGVPPEPAAGGEALARRDGHACGGS